MSILSNRENSVGSYVFADYLESGIGTIILADGSIKTGNITFQDILDVDKKYTPEIKYPCSTTADNAWYLFGIPLKNLWLGQGSSFQPYINSKQPFGIYTKDPTYWGDGVYDYTPVEIETNWLILSTLDLIKELVSFKISYEGTKDFYPTVKVSVKNNYHSNAIEKTLSPYIDLDGNLMYDLRDVSGYKFIKFNISFDNTNDKFISAINTMSIIVKPVKARNR